MYNTSKLISKMANQKETSSWPLCMDEHECPHCYREEEEEDYDGVESDWSSFCLDDEGEEELEDIPPPAIQDIPPPAIQDIPPPTIQDIPPPPIQHMPPPAIQDIPPHAIQNMPPHAIQNIPPPAIQNIPPPLMLEMIELGNGLWIEFDIWNNNQHNWIQSPSSSDSGFTDTDTDTD